MLLTSPPLGYIPKHMSSFDLHLLSTPPAFVLSQDQTLIKYEYLISQIIVLFVFCLYPYLLCCYFFKVLFCFRLSESLFIIHQFSFFVKYFFQVPANFFLMSAVILRQLVYYTSVSLFCQALFYVLFKFLSDASSSFVVFSKTACLLYISFHILSSTFLVPAKFLLMQPLRGSFPRQPVYYTSLFPFCQAENKIKFYFI